MGERWRPHALPIGGRSTLASTRPVRRSRAAAGFAQRQRRWRKTDLAAKERSAAGRRRRFGGERDHLRAQRVRFAARAIALRIDPAALRLPSSFAIGLGSGVDCVDGFIVRSMSDMAVSSVARWPRESERPAPLCRTIGAIAAIDQTRKLLERRPYPINSLALFMTP